MWYLAGKRLLMTGGIDFSKDALCAVLMGDEYVPDAELHKTYNDLTDEAEGTGYRRGGVVITGQRLEEKIGEVHLHVDPIVIPRSTVSASAVVIYHKKTKTLLVCLRDKPAESYEAEFVIEFGDDGVLWL